MSILDYSYLVAMGHNCTPAYQLARIATHHRLPEVVYSGPFDWIGTTIEQSTLAIESRFSDYFRPETVDVVGQSDHAWLLKDRSGAVSWHHLRRAESDTEPSAASWRGFRRWINRRIGFWDRALADAQGNLLIVYLENPQIPDSPESIERLASLLSQRVAGRFSFAAVSFEKRAEVAHPAVRRFAIPRTWPESLHEDAVDWDHDYGFGIAWQGHDPSWNEIWNTV